MAKRKRGTLIRVEFPENDIAVLKMAADAVGKPLAQFVIEAARMRAECVLEPAP